MQVLAGSTTDLYFDPDAQAFAPAGSGPRFTIRAIDFWSWQKLLVAKDDPVAQTRLALEFGLVSIDGDTDLAAQFIATPARNLVNPLFAAIVDSALGN